MSSVLPMDYNELDKRSLVGTMRLNCLEWSASEGEIQSLIARAENMAGIRSENGAEGVAQKLVGEAEGMKTVYAIFRRMREKTTDEIPAMFLKGQEK